MGFPFESKDIIKAYFVYESLWKPPLWFAMMLRFFWWFALPSLQSHSLDRWWFFALVMHTNIMWNESQNRLYFIQIQTHRKSLWDRWILCSCVCCVMVHSSKWSQAKTTLAHMLDKCVFGIAHQKFFLTPQKCFNPPSKRVFFCC